MGDMYLKLPRVYVERVMALATPPFPRGMNPEIIVERARTPPYLSSRAEVVHFRREELGDAAGIEAAYLVVSSDGLGHMYHSVHRTREYAVRAMDAMHRAQKAGENLAVAVLWDAVGGNGEENQCETILENKAVGRVDDVTVVAIALGN